MNEKQKAIKQRNDLLSSKIVQNLKSRKFDAYYFDTKEEALQKVIELIPNKSSIAWGGSATLSEIGVFDKLKQGDYKLIDRDTATSPDERYDLMRQAFYADVYLTSFNAVSESGVLYNIDGMGNRVAAITFGPKSVIAVVGINKVCKTETAALERARTYAAPINVQRCNLNPHFKKIEHTPCSVTGSCENCKADDCICSYIVETRMSKIQGRIKVIIVGEELGI